MSMTPEQLRQHGAPYPSQVAGVGGLPTVSVDVPASAVLMACYASFAVANMYIFQTNKRKGHKFFPSALMFGFCMARLLTLTLRIVLANYPHGVSIAIAANIFVSAGVLIIYVLNVLFATRILRALQPAVGWSRALGIFFKVLYALIAISLVLVIVLTIMSSYSLEATIHSEAMWIQRGAILYMFLFTLVPAVLLAVALLLPEHPDAEMFGHGTMKSKIIILAIGICLTVIISGFKFGTVWMPARPVDNPAWYQSRAAFYCFNFMLELLILALYTPARIDQRLHVPDGSSKRRTYAQPAANEHSDPEEESSLEKKRDSGVGSYV